MAGIASKFAHLNPFGGKPKRDEDDYGEAIDADSVAGGGHSLRPTNITKEGLRVSKALKKFLVDQHVLSPTDVDVQSDETSGPLKELLDLPHVHVPRELTQRGHPLTEYFISSSHNTYLLAHQLYGSSSATAYETALNSGARCLEIDAWDNSENQDEPKVTHGYTLASNVPFRTVCETIRDIVDREAKQLTEAGYHGAPVLISLENHCGAHGQQRLVDIMKEVWAERLLSKAIRDEGTREQHETGEQVYLEELGAKIAVIVEYHLPNEQTSDTSEDEDEDEQSRKDRQQYNKQKRECPAGIIIPELAELGVYAQSVKPVNHTWFEDVLEHGPHHHLINVSESGLSGLLSTNADKIARHNAHHLMRVYPKGTRISSRNLNPVPFWGVGAQICALNMQRFDASLQLNEALFATSDGYILKPAALRAGGRGVLATGRKRRLRVHVAGATDVPLPRDRDRDDEIRPYVTCTLVHPGDVTPPKRKTGVYRPHKLGILHRGDVENPPVTDPVWREELEWEFEENELVFLRTLVKSDDRFARNPVLCVAAVRLTYVVSDWVFVRMLDLKGKETHCTVLMKFEISDV